jgi:EAL domain-containing protein (putative c-di-GMP-specific phosphodiesterase class I)
VAYDRDEEQIAAARRERERSRVMLDEAIATDSLVLRAQPIVQSALDGSQPPTHHYEVLLSIRQEDGSLLSPTEFIASAERFGFINGVDRWVVRRVCEWISSLMDRQKVVPQLSINLSGSSLTDDRFMDYVLEQISEFGVGTSKLCFEITETGAIENLNKAADFIRTLRNIGCTFSLDDFGTGMASHQYLRELPVDNVKIDGMFIRDMASNPNDYAMVRSINDLAHFLGQKTIAESVESVELIEPLHEIGVDYLQGWGVGMPRPLEEVTLELSPLAT